ncbi:hypothetical protein [Paramesorhizobium deserti]|uniref:hypothetical protein n=1 Tax=Paramesorhizobium deserti TaxID=1494590 RepID=UPI00190FC6B3|nr:hypothetical protein [Paramesorhizobium deserti]
MMIIRALARGCRCYGRASHQGKSSKTSGASNASTGYCGRPCYIACAFGKGGHQYALMRARKRYFDIAIITPRSILGIIADQQEGRLSIRTAAEEINQPNDCPIAQPEEQICTLPLINEHGVRGHIQRNARSGADIECRSHSSKRPRHGRTGSGRDDLSLNLHSQPFRSDNFLVTMEATSHPHSTPPRSPLSNRRGWQFTLIHVG